ncbi:SiaB family protein kinase [Pectobacteriaceae bacterium CE90]|nr:SiaB family protein kinase [Prodigiosinella sp. LS101]WJV55010.1 SiaB family protein kinase [Prodigiosinella sp. LS101]WJV59370.1 SiaB family protein kinase [Pectobacteriaceae bacterium C111]WJY14095.1 SiaB family protein kinase [Pectobacteriaceae bacterium CE90]
MSDTNYDGFFDLTQQQDLTLYYVGYFSQNIICSLAETVKLQLEKKQVPANVRRKLFSSFVEIVQNIIRYSAANLTSIDHPNEMRHGLVCIGHEAGKYYLLCANRVHPYDMEKLRVRLEPLRHMTLEEIKLAYKASLRDDTPPQSKGADMGLLTIARDASEPLQFTFRNDESTGFPTFYLKAII